MEEKNQEKERIEAQRELYEIVSSNWVINKAMNLVLGAVVFSYVFYDMIKNGKMDAAKFILQREKRTGLLEDSILQNSLYAPEQDGSLSKIDALAGKWVGYDFKRDGEFGNGAQVIHKGKTYAFLLDEIKNNPGYLKTPTNLIRLFEITHVLKFEAHSIDSLVENELLLPTTYQKSFQKVGIYEQYAKNLDLLEIADECVYQVTPKGNGSIVLGGDGGQPKKFKEPSLQLKPAWM